MKTKPKIHHLSTEERVRKRRASVASKKRKGLTPFSATRKAVSGGATVKIFQAGGEIGEAKILPSGKVEIKKDETNTLSNVKVNGQSLNQIIGNGFATVKFCGNGKMEILEFPIKKEDLHKTETVEINGKPLTKKLANAIALRAGIYDSKGQLKKQYKT